LYASVSTSASDGAAEVMVGKGADAGWAMAEQAKARARTTANICSKVDVGGVQ
jgi:hypothetical protein